MSTFFNFYPSLCLEDLNLDHWLVGLSEYEAKVGQSIDLAGPSHKLGYGREQESNKFGYGQRGKKGRLVRKGLGRSGECKALGCNSAGFSAPHPPNF